MTALWFLDDCGSHTAAPQPLPSLPPGAARLGTSISPASSCPTGIPQMPWKPRCTSPAHRGLEGSPRAVFQMEGRMGRGELHWGGLRWSLPGSESLSTTPLIPPSPIPCSLPARLWPTADAPHEVEPGFHTWSSCTWRWDSSPDLSSCLPQDRSHRPQPGEAMWPVLVNGLSVRGCAPSSSDYRALKARATGLGQINTAGPQIPSFHRRER